QLAADFAGGFFGGAVAQHGGARDDAQVADAKQVRENILMHAVRKKHVGLLVLAPVFERQDGDRAVGRRGGPGKFFAPEEQRSHRERDDRDGGPPRGAPPGARRLVRRGGQQERRGGALGGEQVPHLGEKI